MDQLKFSRDKLLSIVKQNRDKHKSEYDEALAGYRQEVVDYCRKKATEYKKAAASIEAGGDVPIDLIIGPPKPQEYLGHYDRVIRMLELTSDEQVDLDHKESAQYLLDNWSWKEQFVSSTARYANK